MSHTLESTTFGVVSVTLEVSIDAPPERVWKALVEETRWWWQKDCYTGSNPRAFIIEPELGGRMYEDWGDGQGLVWANVVGLRTNAELRLAGRLFPEFGGPASNATRITLAERDGATLLTLVDTTYGAVDEANGATLEEGWRFLFEGCLKPYAETGTRPELPATVR